jgi:hypothetical protein
MKRHRRLRRLVPDGELVRRRAAGETLRDLGPDYGVAHTTLGRYFARPEIAKQLKAARRLERLEQSASGERTRPDRLRNGGWNGNVRREAKRQAALERERRPNCRAPVWDRPRNGSR